MPIANRFLAKTTHRLYMDENADSEDRPPESNEDISLDELEVVKIEAKDMEMPDWLTEMDIEILEVLGHDLILTPSIIAENIDRSREGVSQRLNALQAGELVDKVGRGKYKITYEGLGYVGMTVRTMPKNSNSKNE